MENPTDKDDGARNGRSPRWCLPAAILAAAVGLGLLVDSLGRSSAVYDEVAYLRLGARWWRTGEQAEIARMGTPLLFFKLQQSPAYFALDRLGRGSWVDDPIAHQSEILPWVRLGSTWIWLVGLGLTAGWARSLYGPRAMAFAAWLYALSPNILAHGPLATMETPILAATAGVSWLFWSFLQTGRRRFFWASAVGAGLAFSLKFTAVLLPPLFALVWWVDRYRGGETGVARLSRRVALGMAGFGLAMLLTDWAIGGFAAIPPSERVGVHPSFEGHFGPAGDRVVARLLETPMPQDWVAFATQVRLQRSGGPSYLLGERRMRGWWYYYFVALAAKAPLALAWVTGVRSTCGRPSRSAGRAWILPTMVGAFLAIAAAGSSRNYGVRYLLPAAPLAIVWISGAAESSRLGRWGAWAGLAGFAWAVASIHPHELTYFNAIAGGPTGGRAILSDSNLDWGQGARSLARLQRSRPEFRDLTLYYFGDTDPAHYGVIGRIYVIDALRSPRDLPPRLAARSTYLAISASLQWGPWGPPGYFAPGEGVEPAATTDDGTIVVYRTADLSLESVDQ